MVRFRNETWNVYLLTLRSNHLAIMYNNESIHDFKIVLWQLKKKTKQTKISETKVQAHK